MTGRDTRVLISGGGIAGPALAYWLRRYGFRPTVVERASEVRTGGYRIQIEGSGIQALQRMGLLETFRRHGGPTPSSMRLTMRPGGRPLTLPGGAAVSTEPGLVIQRGTAAERIYLHTKDDVEYRFGDSVTAIHEHPDGATVHFERGESEEYDLVVAADGIRSRTRSLAFGGVDPIHYLGTNLALFTLDNTLGLHDQVIGHAWPRRGCLIATFPGNTALEGNFLFRAPNPVEDVDQHKRLIRGRFGADGWHAPHLLRAMEEAPFAHFAPTAQVRMTSWTSGRVALVGDAGYCPDPMTGQGTSLALVGAAVLAHEISAANGNHRVAYPAYEAAIRGFVDANHAMAGEITRLTAPDAGPKELRVREVLYRGLFGAFSVTGVPPVAKAAYSYPLDKLSQ
ncbi:FAD-dependent monooxygenase [Spiractinospora alimapuensis]|uniref:FAD-dependent monooxygenase n=1 Tax=Spiractinospora alimapuensis TaxID=2820884 RepID=UPI001F46B148|nr:FAD-dependent monooxygenase [Spiractinospora alimapuensis]QVQ50227.1 FAD-dependent monooxygenase [Spiractinospora alimapuensis]